MSINYLNEIPTIIVKSVTNDKGEIKYKELTYPDGTIHKDKNIRILEDGTYYGIYELCELIDRRIMTNQEQIVMDVKNLKKYKTTEEIRNFLETAVQNPYFSKRILPKEYGFYIHESRRDELLDRLEKFSSNPYKRIAQVSIEKIKRSHQKYMNEDGIPKTFEGLTKKEITKVVAITTAALLTVGAVVQIVADKTKKTNITPTTEYYAQEEYQVQLEKTQKGVAENPDTSKITVSDLCDNIRLGSSYHISQTNLYEASDHNGVYGTVSGNYTVSMIAIIDENNAIHTASIEKEKDKSITELITTSNIKEIKNVNVALSTSDGTIIGWIDVDKDNFKQLASQIASEKTVFVTNTYNVTTNNPYCIKDPETGETLNIVFSSLQDENGQKVPDLKVISITDSDGNFINLDGSPAIPTGRRR